MSSANSSSVASIPLHQAVTLRLSKTNYTLWRAQLLLFLRSMKLMGYIDGTLLSLVKMPTSSTKASAEQAPNPTHTHWYDQDQQLLSGLLSSMIEDVL
jgi:hypothetical protein